MHFSLHRPRKPVPRSTSQSEQSHPPFLAQEANGDFASHSDHSESPSFADILADLPDSSGEIPMSAQRLLLEKGV